MTSNTGIMFSVSQILQHSRTHTTRTTPKSLFGALTLFVILAIYQTNGSLTTRIIHFVQVFLLLFFRHFRFSRMADNSYYGRPTTSGAASTTTNDATATPSATSSRPSMDNGKIFVGGLSWQTTEESLQWYFEQYGTVSSVHLMKDRNTGKPRGFGFVSFADPATVDLVMDTGPHEINHKVVDVKRAQARGVAPPSIHAGQRSTSITSSNSDTAMPQTPASSSLDGRASQQQQQQQPTPEQLNTKVFVGGLPHSIDNDSLSQIFSQFGTVVHAIVMCDPTTRKSRGFGFVTFAESASATECIRQQPVPIQGRQVEVKLAIARESANAPSSSSSSNVVGNKFLGLRAGQLSSTNTTNSEFAGFAVAYGRSGWKAGYGSKAFGKAGWAVQGWHDGGDAPERTGFSFQHILVAQQQQSTTTSSEEPPTKRARH